MPSIAIEYSISAVSAVILLATPNRTVLFVPVDPKSTKVGDAFTVMFVSLETVTLNLPVVTVPVVGSNNALPFRTLISVPDPV